MQASLSRKRNLVLIGKFNLRHKRSCKMTAISRIVKTNST